MKRPTNPLFSKFKKDLELLTGRNPLLLLLVSQRTCNPGICSLTRSGRTQQSIDCDHVCVFYKHKDERVVWNIYASLLQKATQMGSDENVNIRYFTCCPFLTQSVLGDIGPRVLFQVWLEKASDAQILSHRKENLPSGGE